MTPFVLAQIIGVFSTIFFTVSVWQKEQKKLLLLSLFGTLAEATVFFLRYEQGGLTGGVIEIIAIVKVIMLYMYKRSDTKPPVAFLVIFILLPIGAGVLAWQNIWGIFVILASSLYTYAMWQESIRVTRFCIIATTMCFLIYDIAVGAYTSCIGLTIEMASVLTAVVRYEVKRKNENNSAK